MLEVGAPDIFEKITLTWHKKRGLFSALLLFVALTSMIIAYFDENRKLTNCYLYSYIIILFVVFIVWLFTTNRVVLRYNKDLVIVIMISVDEEDEATGLYRISKKSIEKLQNDPELSDVKLIFLPTNFINAKKNQKRYIFRNTNSIDLFLILHARSGNVQNDHKVDINELEFIFNFDNLPFERSILLEKINFIQEINFQNFHKKWAILNSNSFEDRVNLKANFEDMLLHATAIQYILKENHEKALGILEKILKKEKINVEVKQNQKIIEINPEFISQSRILHLLSTLYLAVSEKYKYNNPKKTLEFLENLEKIAPMHKYSFLQFIIMARMHYECGNLDNAILYTNKARSINSSDPTIAINRAFFGVLNNDWFEIIQNLKTVFHQRKKITKGIVDVVEFLSREKYKYPNLNTEFEYLISFYEALFLDLLDGKKNLEQLMPILKQKSVPPEVIHFTNRLINSK